MSPLLNERDTMYNISIRRNVAHSGLVEFVRITDCYFMWSELLSDNAGDLLMKGSSIISLLSECCNDNWQANYN